MRWATRRGVHVDRAACAWLIRRSVDSEAEFIFVDDPSEVPADATPFDMRGAELGHHGGDCSFETILHRDAIEIARDLVAAGNRCLITGDMGIANTTASAALICAFTGADPAAATGRGTGIDAATYARKVDVICRGLSMILDDPEVLAVAGAIFDGLYEHRRRALFLGREPA